MLIETQVGLQLFEWMCLQILRICMSRLPYSASYLSKVTRRNSDLQVKHVAQRQQKHSDKQQCEWLAASNNMQEAGNDLSLRSSVYHMM
jgi:hypothetical protein